MWPNKVLVGAALGALLVSSGCRMVGPNYKLPPAPVPTAFKEKPPEGWKEAQPSDALLKGKWWEIYNDPRLNALEEQVDISNQNVLQAEAQYRAARAAVQVARSALYPTLTVGPTLGVSQGSGGVSANQVAAANGVHTTYQIPFDASYQVDLWGAIRRNVRANAETAQATEAQLENIKLTYQADLAQDYFQLHGTDGDVALLQSTVDSYTGYLKLTQARHTAGIASGADVAQAQTQLDSAKEQLIDFGVARTQYEHAIAILIGKPPSELTIAAEPIKNAAAPGSRCLSIHVAGTAAGHCRVGAPDGRVERAGRDRGAAYYPSLTLSAGAGLASSSFVNLFTWAGRFWTAGRQPLGNFVRRRKAARASELSPRPISMRAWPVTVRRCSPRSSRWRTIWSALRILEQETGATNETVKAAQTALDITVAQYKAGTATYLQVETQQTALFAEQEALVNLLTRRMVSSVLLVAGAGRRMGHVAIAGGERPFGQRQTR